MKVGDKVIVTRTYDNAKEGYEGIVVTTDGLRLGILFPEMPSGHGHDLGGLLFNSQMSKGQFVPRGNLKLIPSLEEDYSIF